MAKKKAVEDLTDEDGDVAVVEPVVRLKPSEVAERIREIARIRSVNAAAAGDLEALAFELAGPASVEEPEAA